MTFPSGKGDDQRGASLVSKVLALDERMDMLAYQYYLCNKLVTIVTSSRSRGLVFRKSLLRERKKLKWSLIPVLWSLIERITLSLWSLPFCHFINCSKKLELESCECIFGDILFDSSNYVGLNLSFLRCILLTLTV